MRVVRHILQSCPHMRIARGMVVKNETSAYDDAASIAYRYVAARIVVDILAARYVEKTAKLKPISGSNANATHWHRGAAYKMYENKHSCIIARVVCDSRRIINVIISRLSAALLAEDCFVCCDTTRSSMRPARRTQNQRRVNCLMRACISIHTCSSAFYTRVCLSRIFAAYTRCGVSLRCAPNKLRFVAANTSSVYCRRRLLLLSPHACRYLLLSVWSSLGVGLIGSTRFTNIAIIGWSVHTRAQTARDIRI